MTRLVHKFTRSEEGDFFHTLRSRVHDYFAHNNKERYGNNGMILKMGVMAALFITPFILMLVGLFENPIWILVMWMIMGIGKAGIGLCVMHDANHGSFSKYKWLNKIAGASLYLLGGSARVWKMQHNKLHHSFTNIEGADDDISAPFFLRFSPHQKRRWIHRFQHIYAWFFYGFLTMTWITYNDFIKLVKFKQLGLIKGKGGLTSEIGQIIWWKVFYYGYMLVMPILLIPVSGWWVLAAFLVMHWISGFILSVIFQTAHVMPNSDYPLPDENGRIDNNWALHQMATTTNYAPRSKVFSWLIGGLNYQVEHHLFSNICHTHYRDISKIVAKTAKEYGVEYKTEKNFVTAIVNHGKMLRRLGRQEQIAA